MSEWRAVLLNDFTDMTYITNDEVDFTIQSSNQLAMPCDRGGCPFTTGDDGAPDKYCTCELGVMEKRIHGAALEVVKALMEEPQDNSGCCVLSRLKTLGAYNEVKKTHAGLFSDDDE